MKKSDLIKPLLKVLSTKTEAKSAIETIFSEIKQRLHRGEKVVISGFGTFNVKLTKAKKIKSIHKRTEIILPPRRKVSFHPAKKFL